ncbi:mitochondrial pyruvate carrier 2-like [Bactrocera neohumeralis]|uniref:mitochondrial pyruvate carrier 2-like n=1 Tax=Bactrocera tryoni TaxID=59916 RepID=UPI001A96243B|nr:mitochondrial pyruvate carrier 2-like [Bactrocera tryoni]XP_050317094.1 mitochondrial pyruvate carrier 2-like [Bactrocera neohumeralis]
MSGKVGPLSRIYNGMIGTADKFVPTSMRPLWEHPAGPKTVFFWAPICKWALVIAGIGDMNRPAHSLSLNQCAVIATTGIIWSRYSLVIIPKNYSLFMVNMFVATTQLYQVARALNYQYGLKDKPE